MFKTDILFTGFYGYRNTGDDSFVEVASWGAKKYWSKDKSRFLAIESRLPKTIIPVKGYPLELRKTFKLQAEFLLNNASSFVFAGGSTIHSELAKSNIRMKAVLRKKAGLNLKIGAIGVSVGPFKTIKDERAVVNYLKQMDFLAVRDQASFDFVDSIGNLPYKPVNAFDLAALLPSIYGEVNNVIKIKKTIGISVCPYESLQPGMDIKQEEIRNSMLVDLIKNLDKQEDLHFKFYIINGNRKIGDLPLTKEIIRLSNPKSYEIFSYNRETKKTWESIAQCDFVISTRLHAAIFACFSNTPFMLNEYHRKCGDFLDNVGYNKDYRLYNSEFDIDISSNQILDIVNNKNRYIKPNNVNRMQEFAELNFTSINF